MTSFLAYLCVPALLVHGTRPATDEAGFESLLEGAHDEKVHGKAEKLYSLDAMKGLAEVVIQWSGMEQPKKAEGQRHFSVLPGGTALASVEESAKTRNRRDRRERRQLSVDPVPEGEPPAEDPPAEDPAGTTPEQLTDACQTIDQSSIDSTPEFILDALVNCVAKVKEFAQSADEAKIASKEANEAYKTNTDEILTRLAVLEDYSKSVDAINKDHTAAAQHLLQKAEETQQVIAQLVGGGTANDTESTDNTDDGTANDTESTDNTDDGAE